MCGPYYWVAVALLGSAQVAAPAFGRVCQGAEPGGLIFVDEHGTSRRVSTGELARLPRRTVKVTTSDNQPAEYEGIAVPVLLEHLGVVIGKELRGARLANYLLFEATDGYRVMLALAEVDPATTDKVVLLADRKDGAALPEKEAPLRLVIPDEKRPVRWIRMITKLSVRSAPVDEGQK
jgi:hypothetical protein